MKYLQLKNKTNKTRNATDVANYKKQRNYVVKVNNQCIGLDWVAMLYFVLKSMQKKNQINKMHIQVLAHISLDMSSQRQKMIMIIMILITSKIKYVSK